MVFPSCLIVSIILIDIGNICDNNTENTALSSSLGFCFPYCTPIHSEDLWEILWMCKKRLLVCVCVCRSNMHTSF